MTVISICFVGNVINLLKVNINIILAYARLWPENYQKTKEFFKLSS